MISYRDELHTNVPVPDDAGQTYAGSQQVRAPRQGSGRDLFFGDRRRGQGILATAAVSTLEEVLGSVAQGIQYSWYLLLRRRQSAWRSPLSSINLALLTHSMLVLNTATTFALRLVLAASGRAAIAPALAAIAGGVDNSPDWARFARGRGTEKTNRLLTV